MKAIDRLQCLYSFNVPSQADVNIYIIYGLRLEWYHFHSAKGTFWGADGQYPCFKLSTRVLSAVLCLSFSAQSALCLPVILS